MRRPEISSSNPQLFQTLAQDCGEGNLSLVTEEGYPRCLNVNFAAEGERIYFHGALAGEKFDRIQADPRVGFAMIQPLSYLPSHWISPDNACPATQLFRSVEIKGRCTVVTDPREKAQGLQILMEKYQPEGGFTPIQHTNPFYQKALSGVGVFRVDADSWTGKIRLMQNQADPAAHKIMAQLKERGLPVDLLTAKLMEQHRG